jgi:hypothetical protein
VSLSDKLVELSRPHPGRERRRRSYIGPLRPAKESIFGFASIHPGYYMPILQGCRRLFCGRIFRQQLPFLLLIGTDNAKKMKKNSFFSFDLYEGYIYTPASCSQKRQ